MGNPYLALYNAKYGEPFPPFPGIDATAAEICLLNVIPGRW